MDILRIAARETNCYLLRGRGGTILVDAGPTGTATQIIRQASNAGIGPTDIKLILITHGHWDHYGAVQAIQAWCKAPIAAHPDAPAYSRDKRNALPPAQTVRASAIRWLYLMLSPLLRFAPLSAGLALNDGDSLAVYGVDAQLLTAPGHSPDSLAVLTAEGDALVGDLFVNYTVPGQPLYLWSREAWQASYRRIRQVEPRMVYVGHGEPFSGEELAHVHPPRYQLRWWVH